MIYLVRHGESEGNLNKRFSGITDVELSALGHEQALEAGKKLKGEKILNIFTSPLKRAENTALIIADRINFNKKDIIIDDRLTEINFGIFENMTWEEIEKNHKEESQRWIEDKHRYKFPQGESYEDIIKRISPFLDNVPDNSLLISHFGVIQSILYYWNIVDESTLWKYKISNCDIIVLRNKKVHQIITNR